MKPENGQPVTVKTITKQIIHGYFGYGRGKIPVFAETGDDTIGPVWAAEAITDYLDPETGEWKEIGK